MSKSDLKARPIFHHKRDSIEAHLTIVFAALAIGRMIEYRTGISIKRFVNTVRPIRSGIVIINGKEYLAEARNITRGETTFTKITDGTLIWESQVLKVRR